MNPRTYLKVITFLCFVLFSFIINYSCSKDEELLYEDIFNKPTAILEESLDGNSQIDYVLITEVLIEEPELPVGQDLDNKIFELRTTIFPPTNDGYIQGKAGFDQNIVRLEEDGRASYVMFDLSQIDTLGGSVDETDLEFTVDGDNGNGIISVFKGESKNWAEEELSTATAPRPDSLLGQLSADYEIGSTHIIELDTALVRPEVITLVMVQEEENDFAFASKEHPNQKGPALKVTYNVPQDAEASFFDDVVVSESETDSEIAEQESASEETTDGTHIENNDEPDVPQNVAPRAVAEVDNKSGNIPMKVNLKGDTLRDNLSIEKYIWDFRNGSTATEANPVHTLEKSGKLEVRLTVAYAQGVSHTNSVRL